MTDDLIRDLAAAGLPSQKAHDASGRLTHFPGLEPIEDLWRRVRQVEIATDADRILPVLLKHAGAKVRRELLRAMLDERFAQLTATEVGELSDALAGLEYSVREEGRDAASDPRGFTSDVLAILSVLDAEPKDG